MPVDTQGKATHTVCGKHIFLTLHHAEYYCVYDRHPETQTYKL
jgi:hypothetical protein